jgi:hypothetical protein
VLLLAHVAARADPELNAAMRTAFESNVVKLANLSVDRWGLRPWAEKFADVRSGADVRDLLEHVPPGTPVEAVARIWDEALLPVIAPAVPDVERDRDPRSDAGLVAGVGEALPRLLRQERRVAGQVRCVLHDRERSQLSGQIINI